MNPNGRLTGLKGGISNLSAVRRPIDGNDRMSDAKGNLRVVAVAVCDHDGIVVFALLRNISDACRKIAFFSGQTFKDSVCNLMGIKTQVIFRGNIGSLVGLLLFHRVKETELDFIASVGSACHGAVGKCADAGCA